MRRWVWVLMAFVVMAGAVVGSPVRGAHAAGALPILRVGSLSIAEGDVGTISLVVPVDLSFPVSSTVTVNYALGGGNATANSDYVAKSGKLTFPPGLAAKKVTVKLIADMTAEPDESVNVTLSSPVGATIGNNGVVTFRDDDTNNPTHPLRINVGDVWTTRPEGGKHKIAQPVVLSKPLTTDGKFSLGLACTSYATLNAMGLPSKFKDVKVKAGKQLFFVSKTVPASTTALGTLKYFQRAQYAVNGETFTNDGMVTIADPQPAPPVAHTVFDELSLTRSGAVPQQYERCPILIGSRPEAVTPDGRFFLYTSSADDIVPGDTNKTFDLFLLDRSSGAIERVDLTDNGGQLAKGAGDYAWISDDGRYVFFQTESPELAPPGAFESFVHDRVTGRNEFVGIMPNGRAAEYAGTAGMSADGRTVGLFMPPQSLYVRDLDTETTQLVASTVGWRMGALSADGSEVAFVSADPTLVPNDTNNYADVFVKNLATGAIERANVDSNGQQQPNNDIGVNATRPQMTPDGRYVLIWQRPPGAKGSVVLLRDRVLHTTERIDVGITITDPVLQMCNADDEMVSDDGRYVSFEEICQPASGKPYAGNLFGAYVRDRQAGKTYRIDKLPNGTLDNGPWPQRREPWMVGNGSEVLLNSLGSNLVANDTNNLPDIFVRATSTLPLSPG